jgi:HSP20 family protein
MFRSNYPLRSSRVFGEELPMGPRSLQKTLDSVLQDMWEPYFASSKVAFTPQIDIEEDEKQVRILAELPGLQEEDIEIVYEPGSLILRGEKKEEEHLEYPSGRGRYDERRYGAFERRIPLRAEVEEDQIQANFDRGLLIITLPKTAEVRAQARKIPVQLGKSQRQIESGRSRSSGTSATH